jgi:hypothetical protein
MRSGNPVVRKGTGRVSKEFWKLPKPEDPRRIDATLPLRGPKTGPLAALEVLGQLGGYASRL